ncbi:MAG TPA: RNA polymerase sigma-70 factor [Porphyromonadaceae bacterium]|nr:RNA polymerase sigma-70 factor [Porphyromonadaceae bacterium]
MDINHFSLDQINKMDAAAFRALYKAYYKALVGYSIQMVGEVEAAEDIVGNFFTSLWEKKLSFRSLISLQTYLYNSVRNASLNYLKHKNIESDHLQKVADHYKEHYFAGEDADDFFSEEIYRLLFQAIDALPKRCREVFLLAMEGKKNDEIAAILQVSLETVKTQKKRGMSSLRTKLINQSMVFLEFLLL